MLSKLVNIFSHLIAGTLLIYMSPTDILVGAFQAYSCVVVSAIVLYLLATISGSIMMIIAIKKICDMITIKK